MSNNLVIPSERDLPIWMQQSLRGLDWGALLVIFSCLLISWNYLRNPDGIPATETEHFLYLADDYANAFAEGLLYPRWSPESIGGSGAPVPHFYPPGTPYMIALFKVLFTNNTVTALQWLYTLATILMGGTMYAFAAQRGGAVAGVIAGLLVITSPYIGLTTIYATGNVAEYVGIALFCTQLWAVNRLVSGSGAIDVSYISLSIAAALVTFPLYGIVGIVLLLLTGVYHRKTDHFLWIWSGVGLGIALAAFYWLPFLIESGQIDWTPQLAAVSPELQPAAVFTPHQLFDSLSLVHLSQYGLGIPIIVLNLIGLGSILFQRRFQSLKIYLWLGVIFCFAAIMILPKSPAVIGLLTIALSLTAARHAVFWLGSGIRRLWLLTAAVSLIWLCVLPVYITLPSNPITYTDTISEYEAQGYGVAVLPNDADLPVSIRILDYVSSSPMTGDRFIHTSDNIQIDQIDRKTASSRYQISASEPTRILYEQTYFEGWAASINGQPIPLEPDPVSGLSVLTIPGDARGPLTIELGSTFLRRVGWVISLAAVGMGAVLYIYRKRHIPADFNPATLLRRSEIRHLGVVFLIAAASKLLLTPARIEPITDLLPSSSIQQAQLTRYPSDGNLWMTGYYVAETNTPRGQSLTIQLFWEIMQPASQQYLARLRLINRDDPRSFILSDLKHPGDLPSNRWIPGYYVHDLHQIRIPQNALTGTYIIAIEIYTCEPLCQQFTLLLPPGEDSVIRLTLPQFVHIE